MKVLVVAIVTYALNVTNKDLGLPENEAVSDELFIQHVKEAEDSEIIMYINQHPMRVPEVATGAIINVLELPDEV